MESRATHAPTPQLADWSDVLELQRKLAEACDEIAGLAPDTGSAKHVIEYDGDMRKRALARAMAAPLAGGESGVKAEAMARASETYKAELDVLAKSHLAAQQQVQAHEAAKCKWETARSLLAMCREQVKM